MPYTNDYVTANDCDTAGDWTAGGQAGAAILNTTKQLEGTGCIEMRTSSTTTGEATWFCDLTGNEQFRLDQEDLLVWFFYVKGKGAAYLGTAASSFKIRCYLGAPTNNDYVEYNQGGDADLRFGWDVYTASGSEWDTSNGTVDLTNNVQRIMIVLNFANANNDTEQDAGLLMDYWRHGTKITVSEGTPGSPVNFSDIETYSDNNVLGVVSVSDTFVNLICGLDIGDGTAANDGSLSDSGKFVLFNQLSEEVKHPLNVKNFSTFQLGTLEVGDDGEYAVDGCQLVLPPNRYSDINVENGATFKLYDSKVFRWRYVFLGDESDATSVIELNIVDFDANETIYFRANTLNIQNIEIHDNAYQINAFAAVITVTPDTSINFSLYNCASGIRIRDDITLTEYIAGDNALSDLEVLDGKTVTLVNSQFSVDKIKRFV